MVTDGVVDDVRVAVTFDEPLHDFGGEILLDGVFEVGGEDL